MEIINIQKYGIEYTPQTIFPTKGWNPAFHRNSRTGECCDVFSISDNFSSLFNHLEFFEDPC